MKISIILFLFVTLAANLQTAAQTVKPGEITEITLQDGDGFCYNCGRKTTLKSDGSALYVGGKNSRLRAGKFVGKFGKKEFERLAAILVKAGFVNLKDRYEGNFSDVSTIVITVAYGGNIKSIENFGRSREPQAVAVQRAIETAAAKIEWRKFDSETEKQPLSQPDAFAHLKNTHAAAVKNHIGTGRHLRPALETDCENREGLALMREAGGADYHPYYAVYDFDNNDIEDFAVVLFDPRAKPENRFSLIVFKGAANNAFKPAFTIPKVDMSSGGLELETPEETVERRLIHFQTGRGCSVLHRRSRRLVLTDCDEKDN